MRNKRINVFSALALTALLYYFLAYSVDRHETATLLLVYTLLFVLYVYLIYVRHEFNIKSLLISAILLRLIFLVAMPALSDDFYRFIWDGRLWAAGINPFANLPVFYLTNAAPAGITMELFQLINSPTHYTVYPPIPQFVNVLAVWLSPESIPGAVMVMRLVLIAAELGTLVFLYKILKTRPRSFSAMAVYAFNPLIIIEIAGNLHHEGLLLFFFAGFIFYFKREKWVPGAAWLAASVASKLIPLIFLPYLMLRIKGKGKWLFLTSFSVTLLILFVPLLDASFFAGLTDSLRLYYQKLEFNGGLYFLVREIGYQVKGYNIIASSGKAFAVISTILILSYSIYSSGKTLLPAKVFTWIMLIFAAFSLIWHPWYIATFILLSVFTGYLFPLVWSYFIFLTYAGYTSEGYHDTNIIFIIEYLMVFAAILFDIYLERQRQRGRATPNWWGTQPQQPEC
jgi:hypothetical protein